MKIALDHIKDKPVVIRIDEPVEKFPILAGMHDDKSCSITGNVCGDIVVAREYENIRVTGRLTAPLMLVCSRCLADFPSSVDTSFTVFYRKECNVGVSEDSEVELGEIDLISSSYSGEEIDLTHEIDEQIAMEVPLKPVCDDSCKGLCHECGNDLNRFSCQCSRETVSMSFSALKNYKVLEK